MLVSLSSANAVTCVCAAEAALTKPEPAEWVA